MGEGTNGGLAVIRSKVWPRTGSNRSPSMTSRLAMPRACALKRVQRTARGLNIHGANVPRRRGGQQRVNARSGTQVEGRADGPADRDARQMAANGVARVAELGPGVIGKDQPPSDRVERRPRPH